MTRPLIFRNSQFAIIWFSQVISQTGTRMFQIAVMWYLVSLAGSINSSLRVGIFMACSALPALLLASKIGKTVDSVSGKKILLTVEALGVLTSLLFAVFNFNGLLAFPLLLLFGLLFSTFQAFIEPTLNKSVPQIVKAEEMTAATSFISATGLFASFTGALFGALLIERLGLSGITLLNGACLAISFLIDSRLKLTKPEQSEPEQLQTSAWQIVKRIPQMPGILFGFTVVNFFSTPVLMVLPLYTKLTLGGSAKLLAILEAMIWLGLLSGSFALKIFPETPNIPRFIAWCLAAMGGFFFIPGIVHQPLPVALALIAITFALGVLNVRMISYFHILVQEHEKGRFFALMQALVSTSLPVAFFVFGLLGERLSPPALFILQAVGIVAVAAYFMSLAKAHKATVTGPVPLSPTMAINCGVKNEIS